MSCSLTINKQVNLHVLREQSGSESRLCEAMQCSGWHAGVSLVVLAANDDIKVAGSLSDYHRNTLEHALHWRNIDVLETAVRWIIALIWLSKNGDGEKRELNNDLLQRGLLLMLFFFHLTRFDCLFPAKWFTNLKQIYFLKILYVSFNWIDLTILQCVKWQTFFFFYINSHKTVRSSRWCIYAQVNKSIKNRRYWNKY